MQMNTMRLACCCIAAAWGNANAQSDVATYGLVDVNISNSTHFTPDGGSVTRVNSGGMNTSRLGFRGKEIIPGGMTAVYQVEIGIAADTGMADNPLFKRHAFVGLEGRYGSLLLGRTFTSVYDFLLPYDPMGYAPAYSWAPAGHGSGVSKYGMAFWFDNMVKYTASHGNFSIGASYGLGEQGRSGDGAKAALAANYARGPWSVAATWERINGPAGERDVTTAHHAAAMYTYGPLKLQTAVRNYRRDSGTDLRARLFWAGASYLVTPPLTLTGALYYQDVRHGAAQLAGDPMMVVVRARYALSKRTDLYLTAAKAKAHNGVAVSLSRDEIGYASTQRSILAGIQQRF